MGIELKNLDERVGTAVGHYWSTLQRQAAKQQNGDSDRGGRAGVTGGKQMDGFSELVKAILVENGMPRAHVFSDQKLELPGYFRPSKKWDMVVVYQGQLVAALEFKSQAGPSFGTTSTIAPKRPLALPRTSGLPIAKAHLSSRVGRF